MNDLFDTNNHDGKSNMLRGVVWLFVGVGVLFTGYLNFMLYARAFPDTMRVLGIIPVVLIEGSLVVFMMGNIYWFAHGDQAECAKWFGWIMFVIVALNTIIEFNERVGNNSSMGDWLNLYAFWGLPVVVVATIAFWKLTLDADPQVHETRIKRKITQALQVGTWQAKLDALKGNDTAAALGEHGKKFADGVNATLRGLPHSTPVAM